MKRSVGAVAVTARPRGRGPRPANSRRLVSLALIALQDGDPGMTAGELQEISACFDGVVSESILAADHIERCAGGTILFELLLGGDLDGQDRIIRLGRDFLERLVVGWRVALVVRNAEISAAIEQTAGRGTGEQGQRNKGAERRREDEGSVRHGGKVTRDAGVGKVREAPT